MYYKYLLLVLLTAAVSSVINSESEENGLKILQAELIDDGSSGLNELLLHGDMKTFLNDSISFNISDSTTNNGSRSTIAAEEVCRCWDAKFDLNSELECSCNGSSLYRIPQKLPQGLVRLTITSSPIEQIRTIGLKIYNTTLKDVILTNLDEFQGIREGAFENLRVLRKIYISNAPKLTFLSKEVFRGISTTIKTIRILNCGLTRVPDLSLLPPTILQMIDFEGNKIDRIESSSVNVKTEQLILDNNQLVYIEESAFNGSHIEKLSIKSNFLLESIHPSAFKDVKIQDLDLSSTSLVSLPYKGLHEIEKLRIQNTHTLKTIPSIYKFNNLKYAQLTHPFHCCAFKFPSRHDRRLHDEKLKELAEIKEQCKNYTGNEERKKRNLDTSTFNETDVEFFEYTGNFQEEDGANILDEVNEMFGTFHTPVDTPSGTDAVCGSISKIADVICTPVPDDLNPCEDVMGSDWLRICVWVVAFFSIIGNSLVLVVILFTIRSDNHSVPKFLMCHLATADLCTGLYLLLIACMDVHSIGEYFNYAYDWQYGAGCKVAGFLTVFANHLSVFTLTIITLERWFAITNAMFLNKRIKMKSASVIMVGGWIYSIVMSVFPLYGVSNYSSTSICLPMEARDTPDIIYLIAIIGINGIAFFVIALCYSQIYYSLASETRRSRQGHGHAGEMSVAKKMALLVCTNFACWAPIAFFGLTAIAGYPLINVTNSKILLVFFYPMNSCADPYLYAILTEQFRKDFYNLMSKLGLCRDRAERYKGSGSILQNTTLPTNSVRRNTPSPNLNVHIKANETQLLNEDFV